MRWSAMLLLMMIVLSGCSVTTGDRQFTVPEDAGSSADRYDGDGYDLHVRVTDQNGTPLAGAAVVYFETSRMSGSGSVSGGASGGASSGTSGGDVFWQMSFDDHDMVAGLRTDADGMVAADLPPDTMIHLAAGDVDSMTTEARTGVTVGGGGEAGTVTIPLYPETIHHTFEVSVGDQVGRAGLQEQFETFPMPLSEDSGLHAAYQQRLYSFDVAATWTNDETGGADLYVGAGGRDGPEWTGPDDQQYVMDGEHTEELAVGDGDLDGHRQALADDGLYLHLLTDWISLSFDGVEVDVEVEARLKGSDIVIR